MAARQGGFTLIELLVALAVFAVMSTMAYSGLAQLLNVRSVMESQAEEMARLQMAMSVIERDLEQAAPYPSRGVVGEPARPALMGEDGVENFLELTRNGRRNPLGARRSSLQRIAYAFIDGKLQRAVWPGPDQPPEIAPYLSELLTGVEEVEVRFLDQRRQWRANWPQGGVAMTNAPMPEAVEIVVQMPGWGRIRRVFALNLG
ncbi:type II secretion system minor pseudopilin GspJ [Magnetofaba australis]|uniref:Type II secretion system protein J n=1 Tax=Magnetofaba australis IT-1 TaxID=1434232 RepID=A0A1Y2K6R9_9PROT|nr:type II secretion system minor pseudopilin GspJ [Magnetofaba australis]OSM05329.1 putative general secretion pathway protein J [Magnetofaba australis IT-1]